MFTECGDISQFIAILTVCNKVTFCYDWRKSTSMTFKTLHLKVPLLQVLDELGYTSPTTIQGQLIPAIFSNRDVLAGAQTGTGKTAGYALPILQDLAGKLEDERHYPKAVVLVPTRELAKQVYDSFRRYGRYLPLFSTGLFGGVKFDVQANGLKRGMDIIIATPGRLLEHLQKKSLTLEGVKYLVLDEADTILDMGFLGEVSQVIRYLPKKRQNILISATLSVPLKKLSRELLVKPECIEVDSMGTVSEGVAQSVYPVESEKKLELLAYLIGCEQGKQALVFVRKKCEADRVGEGLQEMGLQVGVIHGDKTSADRMRRLTAFKRGDLRVLVATDIAARGIDIPSLERVYSYDIPHVIQDYIHRIGRTGRAGKEGKAVLLVSPPESVALKDLEKLLKRQIPRTVLDGYAPKVLEVKQTRKRSGETKKTAGAFGKKKKKLPVKKRKTTKRDGFKTLDNRSNNNQKRKK